LESTREDHRQKLIASGQLIAATGEGEVVDDPPVDDGVEASTRPAAKRDTER
jgi:hypothetical protein